MAGELRAKTVVTIAIRIQKQLQLATAVILCVQRIEQLCCLAVSPKLMARLPLFHHQYCNHNAQGQAECADDNQSHMGKCELNSC